MSIYASASLKPGNLCGLVLLSRPSEYLRTSHAPVSALAATAVANKPVAASASATACSRVFMEERHGEFETGRPSPGALHRRVLLTGRNQERSVARDRTIANAANCRSLRIGYTFGNIYCAVPQYTAQNLKPFWVSRRRRGRHATNCRATICYIVNPADPWFNRFR